MRGLAIHNRAVSISNANKSKLDIYKTRFGSKISLDRVDCHRLLSVNRVETSNLNRFNRKLGNTNRPLMLALHRGLSHKTLLS